MGHRGNSNKLGTSAMANLALNSLSFGARGIAAVLLIKTNTVQK